MTPYKYVDPYATPTPDGYYWIRVGADKPEIGFIDSTGWYICGDQVAPDEVTVYSERLVPPLTP